MNKNIVLWGQVEPETRALLAIQLNEELNKVLIYGYPEEEVNENLQNSLFAWKNGAPFDFSASNMTWSVDAQSESILPREIRVDKPEFIQRAQIEWGKLLMSSRIFKAAKEEIVLHKTLVDSSKEFQQELWDKTKNLWDKYSQMLKDREITWEHSQLLKAEIDETFQILKSQIDSHKKQEKSKVKEVIKAFEKEIEQLKSQAIYPEEWPKIHKELKRLQEEIKKESMRFHFKKPLFQKIDEVYKMLRSYKETQSVGHIRSRLQNLNRILKNTQRALKSDIQSLDFQKEKLSHYIKGANPNADQWGGLLKPIQDKIKSNQEKEADIKKTIAQLKRKLTEMEAKSKLVEEAKKESEPTKERTDQSPEANETTTTE